jgi:hypothetical protein
MHIGTRHGNNPRRVFFISLAQTPPYFDRCERSKKASALLGLHLMFATAVMIAVVVKETFEILG